MIGNILGGMLGMGAPPQPLMSGQQYQLWRLQLSSMQQAPPQFPMPMSAYDYRPALSRKPCDYCGTARQASARCPSCGAPYA